MGNFEMDLIIGTAPNEAMLTLTDRKTDFAIIEPLTLGRKAKPLSEALIKNALIRQYLPKGISFKNLYRKEIIPIDQKLNSRPRKKLNFKTPIEVFLLNLS